MKNPSHKSPRRLGADVIAYLERINVPKILFQELVVKGKTAFPRCLIFLNRIDDLHLKSAQNRRFSVPLTSGRTK